MLDIVELSLVSTIFCERSAVSPGLLPIIIEVAQKNNKEPHAAHLPSLYHVQHAQIAAPKRTTVAALRRSARRWLRSAGLLERLLKILKNRLISSMYATAQKCPHINGILEKLSIAKKFSREYMLL